MIEKSEFAKNVVFYPFPGVIFTFSYLDTEKEDAVAAWVRVARIEEHSCPKCWAPATKKSKTVKIYTTDGGNGKAGLVSCEKCKSYSSADLWKKTRLELIDIRVEPEYRGLGYGKLLIELLKDKCDHLLTSYGESTDEGRGLCMAMGMVRNGNILEWRRSETNK